MGAPINTGSGLCQKPLHSCLRQMNSIGSRVKQVTWSQPTDREEQSFKPSKYDNYRPPSLPFPGSPSPRPSPQVETPISFPIPFTPLSHNTQQTPNSLQYSHCPFIPNRNPTPEEQKTTQVTRHTFPILDEKSDCLEKGGCLC